MRPWQQSLGPHGGLHRRKARILHQHGIAGRQKRLGRQGKGLAGAGGDDDLSGADIQPAPGREVRGNGGAQRRVPGRIGQSQKRRVGFAPGAFEVFRPQGMRKRRQIGHCRMKGQRNGGFVRFRPRRRGRGGRFDMRQIGGNIGAGAAAGIEIPLGGQLIERGGGRHPADRQLGGQGTRGRQARAGWRHTGQDHPAQRIGQLHMQWRRCVPIQRQGIKCCLEIGLGIFLKIGHFSQSNSGIRRA